MRNIYLNLGTNNLVGVLNFHNEHKGENWQYELFEPHPGLVSSLISSEIPAYGIPNINFHPVGVWTENCKKCFYPGLGRRTQSSGLVRKRLQSSDCFEIDCIDLNQWILDNLLESDNIHMHMDIEGSEYEVLPHMIKGGSMSYIKSVTIEFHLKILSAEGRRKYEGIHQDLYLFFEKFTGNKVLWKLFPLPDRHL